MPDPVALLFEYLPHLIGLLALLILLMQSIAIAGGDQFLTLERRWFGSQMADGRTIALRDEVGVQARTLGPGFHLLVPFIYKVTKHSFVSIGTNQIGIMKAITGLPMPAGQFFAKTVECNLFQDGEAFLRNGPQLAILPPGEYQINPHLFVIEIEDAVIIEETEIGIVEAVAGKPCPVGRIFAEPVDCDSFQDADAFLHNGGQKGPQISILPPGNYRINTALFQVEHRAVTVIANGHMGLVTAMDGSRVPDGNLLGRKVEGHSNFENGDAFMKNGGQKGHQLDVLMPGTYRINTALFAISAVMPWTAYWLRDDRHRHRARRPAHPRPAQDRRRGDLSGGAQQLPERPGVLGGWWPKGPTDTGAALRQLRHQPLVCLH
jgi:hypothetical protein